MTVIPLDEMDRAWRNFMHFYGWEEGSDWHDLKAPNFWDFIKNPVHNKRQEGWPCTDEQLRIVRLLAGPHCHTVLKAHEACQD